MRHNCKQVSLEIESGLSVWPLMLAVEPRINHWQHFTWEKIMERKKGEGKEVEEKGKKEEKEKDLGSIPGLGRSPGEGNGNPLQYPCW